METGEPGPTQGFFLVKREFEESFFRELKVPLKESWLTGWVEERLCLEAKQKG